MAGRKTAIARARAIREVLLDYGVPEVSIEVVEGRPTSGDRWNSLDPVAVMSHHIASNPTVANPAPGLALVKRGRSDLPGPLCNGTAGVDLVYRIICLGLANHSGTGGPWTVRGPLGSFTIPRDVGRPYIWGTEYEGGYTDAVWDKVYTNRRTGKKMSFREFMGRANAGLVEAIWLPGVSSRGKYGDIRPGMDLSTYHGEHGRPWAVGRKPDRRGYTSDVAIGRNEIRKYANKQQEDDVAAKDVWTGKESDLIPVPKNRLNDEQRKKNPTFQAKNALSETWARSIEAAQRTRQIQATLNELAKAVNGIELSEESIARETARLILPDLEELVREAVTSSENRDADEVASAVVSAMAARLAAEA